MPKNAWNMNSTSLHLQEQICFFIKGNFQMQKIWSLPKYFVIGGSVKDSHWQSNAFQPQRCHFVPVYNTLGNTLNLPEPQCLLLLKGNKCKFLTQVSQELTLARNLKCLVPCFTLQRYSVHYRFLIRFVKSLNFKNSHTNGNIKHIGIKSQIGPFS